MHACMYAVCICICELISFSLYVLLDTVSCNGSMYVFITVDYNDLLIVLHVYLYLCAIQKLCGL